MRLLPTKVLNNMIVQLGDDNNCVNVTLHRTLRIPEDNKDYSLPPSLGLFNIQKVDDFKNTVPKKWLDTGGIFFPMYQREAMWIKFDLNSTQNKPKAVKIGVGKINAVSGDDWKNELDKEQDYVVVPDQRWLDGINSGGSHIKQFVAMPTGSGYTVEAQVKKTTDEVGGIQLLMYDSGEQRNIGFDRVIQPPRNVNIPIIQPTQPNVNIPRQPVFYDPLIQRGSPQRAPQQQQQIVYQQPQQVYNPPQQVYQPPQPIIYDPPQPVYDQPYRPPVRRNPRPVVCKRAVKSSKRAKKKPKPRPIPRSVLGHNVDRIAPSFPIPSGNIVAESSRGFSGRGAAGSGGGGGYIIDDVDEGEENYEEDLSIQPQRQQQLRRSEEHQQAKELGISAGGKISQNVVKDKHGFYFWDQNKFARIFVHICNSAMYEQITGQKAPDTPVSQATYRSHGYPWYETYNESGVKKSSVLGNVKSVSEVDREKTDPYRIRDGKW